MSARLDYWLWTARFYKTRLLAKEAITGGKIDCCGVKAKPSKNIQIGDLLIITKSPYQYHVVVKNFSPTRRPFSEAKLLYEETETSLATRNKISAEQQTLRAGYTPPPSKPHKKQRQKLRQLRQKN